MFEVIVTGILPGVEGTSPIIISAESFGSITPVDNLPVASSPSILSLIASIFVLPIFSINIIALFDSVATKSSGKFILTFGIQFERAFSIFSIPRLAISIVFSKFLSSKFCSAASCSGTNCSMRICFFAFSIKLLNFVTSPSPFL